MTLGTSAVTWTETVVAVSPSTTEKRVIVPVPSRARYSSAACCPAPPAAPLTLAARAPACAAASAASRAKYHSASCGPANSSATMIGNRIANSTLDEPRSLSPRRLAMPGRTTGPHGGAAVRLRAAGPGMALLIRLLEQRRLAGHEGHRGDGDGAADGDGQDDHEGLLGGVRTPVVVDVLGAQPRESRQ